MRPTYAKAKSLVVLVALHQASLVSCVNIVSAFSDAVANIFIAPPARAVANAAGQASLQSIDRMEAAGHSLIDHAASRYESVGGNLIQRTQEASDATIRSAGREANALLENVFSLLESTSASLIEEIGGETSKQMRVMGNIAKDLMGHAVSESRPLIAAGGAEIRLIIDHSMDRAETFQDRTFAHAANLIDHTEQASARLIDRMGDQMIRVGTELTGQVRVTIEELASAGAQKLLQYSNVGQRALMDVHTDLMDKLEMKKVWAWAPFSSQNYRFSAGITVGTSELTMESLIHSDRALSTVLKLECLFRGKKTPINQKSTYRFVFLKQEDAIFQSDEGFIQMSNIMSAAIGFKLLAQSTSVRSRQVQCVFAVRSPVSTYTGYVSFDGTLANQVPAAIIKEETAIVQEAFHPRWNIDAEEILRLVESGTFSLTGTNAVAFYLPHHHTNRLMLENRRRTLLECRDRAYIEARCSRPMQNRIACCLGATTHMIGVPFGTYLVPGDRILAPSGRFSIEVEADSVSLYALHQGNIKFLLDQTNFTDSGQITQVAAFEDGKLTAIMCDGRLFSKQPSKLMVFATLGPIFGFTREPIESLYLDNLIAQPTLEDMEGTWNAGTLNGITDFASRALRGENAANLTQVTTAAMRSAFLFKSNLLPLMTILKASVEDFIGAGGAEIDREVRFRLLTRRYWLVSSMGDLFLKWGNETKYLINGAVSSIYSFDVDLDQALQYARRLTKFAETIDQLTMVFASPVNLQQLFRMHSLESVSTVVSSYLSRFETIINDLSAPLL